MDAFARKGLSANIDGSDEIDADVRRLNDISDTEEREGEGEVVADAAEEESEETNEETKAAAAAAEEEEAAKMEAARIAKQGPFQWLPSARYTEIDDNEAIKNLSKYGFTIIQFDDDAKAPGEQFSEHIMNDIIKHGPEQHKHIFDKHASYGRTLGKYHLLEYLKKLTLNSHKDLTNAEKKKIEEKASAPFVAPIKAWQPKDIYHKLHLPSLDTFGWHRTTDKASQKGPLRVLIQRELKKHRTVFSKLTKIHTHIAEYNASIPHKAPKVSSLCPIYPVAKEGVVYIGHLAATDVTFCYQAGSQKKTNELVTKANEGTNMPMYLGLGDEKNIFAKQRVITIPAGHALIHHPDLVYVPLANLFEAMNTTHLWACTFYLSEKEETADASGDELEAVPATGAPAAKKARAAAAGSEPSVYFGASRLPAGYVETQYPADPQNYTVHHSEITQLEDHIKRLTATLDLPDISNFKKQNTVHQIARLHEMLKSARDSMPFVEPPGPPMADVGAT